MSDYEQQYLDLCKYILDKGTYKQNRTGTGTYSIFGATLRHDLNKGFPLLTTKKVNFNIVAGELLWFLSGKTDLPSLRKYQNKPEDSHTIWSDDFEKFWLTANQSSFREAEDGGFIYGKQLREFSVGDEDRFIDQLQTLIENIKAVKEKEYHPTARRLRCTFWNPYDHLLGDKKWCALPACHTDFQCIVTDGKLNLSFNMRSNDIFLGHPFDFASYSLLCHILAQLTGLDVGEVVYFGTDVHLYSNHIDAINTQLRRARKSLPKIVMPKFTTLEELLYLTGEDFQLEGYNPESFIKAQQAS